MVATICAAPTGTVLLLTTTVPGFSAGPMPACTGKSSMCTPSRMSAKPTTVDRSSPGTLGADAIEKRSAMRRSTLPSDTSGCCMSSASEKDGYAAVMSSSTPGSEGGPVTTATSLPAPELGSPLEGFGRWIVSTCQRWTRVTIHAAPTPSARENGGGSSLTGGAVVAGSPSSATSWHSGLAQRDSGVRFARARARGEMSAAALPDSVDPIARTAHIHS